MKSAQMLTSLKEKKTFIIGNTFILLEISENILKIEFTDKNLESDIWHMAMVNIPEQIKHLFNSLKHLYNYFTSSPHKIIKLSQGRLSFVVEINGYTDIHTLILQRYEQDRERISMKKQKYLILQKLYQVGELSKILSIQKQKRDQCFKQLTSRIQIEKNLLSQEKNKENSMNEQYQRKIEEREQLTKILQKKQKMLVNLKRQEGAFVELDD